MIAGKPTESIGHTMAFLRMAAIQLRRIAERAPHVADQLRYTADGLEAEADELERHCGIPACAD